jgi:hypothetical protein
MAIQTIWDDEDKTTIRYVFDGAWTWEELGAAFVKAHEMMDTVKYSVDTIIDMRGSKMLPNHAIAGIQRVGVMETGHPNHSRLTVFVDLSVFAKAVLQIVSRAYRQLLDKNDFRFTSTLEEARLIVREARVKERSA